MKIAVLGANGRTGKVFVQKALAQNHTVTAGARESLSSVTPNVKVFTGDARDASYLRRLFEDQDCVVSLIGHGPNSPSDLQTVAMKATIMAMEDLKIPRLVTLTGTGVRMSGDRITIPDRVLNWGVRKIDPERVVDGINFTRLLEQSSLEWTILRVLKLEPFDFGPHALTVHGPTKVVISHQHVAELMLDVLVESSFIRQAPIVGRR